MTNKIGYACMNMDTSPNVFRSCRLSNLTDAIARELIHENLLVLSEMIAYNIKHHCKMYRISSSLIPFASNPALTLDWQEEFGEELKEIGSKIKENEIRVSMHPGQYTIINSPNPKVVESSIKDLEYHADVLDLLGVDENAKLILHIGGLYGDRESARERFIQNYQRLSDRIKSRLIIENDDKLFTVEDVLYISGKTGAPVVFDNLHHKLNPSYEGLNEKDILNMVVKTWPKGQKPKMHYSQQDSNKQKGAHTPTIYIRDFYQDYQDFYSHFDLDIMLEVKDKNRSFKKIHLLLHPNQKELEEEWAKYKYLVMAKSYQYYSEIRALFKEESVDVVAFYELVEKSLDAPNSVKAEVTALEHMWGYFKKEATAKEKESFFRDLKKLEEGQKSYSSLRKKLNKLGIKYKKSYILQAY